MELDLSGTKDHLNKGYELFKQNRFEEAIKEFDKAIELDPKNPYYLILYAKLEADLGSPEKGINKIKDLVSSGVVNRNKLCERINKELKEIKLNEKEELERRVSFVEY